MIRLTPVLLALAACSAASPSKQPAAADRVAAHVVDRAGLLPAATAAAIDTKLRGFERATHRHILVVTVKSLGGRSIEELSSTLGNELNAGRGSYDNSVLLLVALDDREVRLSVGDGLTNQLTPAAMNEILSRDVQPALHANDFPQGINAGVDALVRALTPKSDTI